MSTDYEIYECTNGRSDNMNFICGAGEIMRVSSPKDTKRLDEYQGYANNILHSNHVQFRA